MDARTMHPSRIGHDLLLFGEDAGLLLAPVGEDGAWEAVRDLRRGVRASAEGRDARVTFLLCLTADGRIVDLSHPEAAAVLLGYRISDRQPAERR